MTNPLQYTSRTFNTILADINSDDELIDKPDWWKRALAGLGDIFSMMLNAEANQAVLDTAFTRQAVSDLLALIDYNMTEQQTASGSALFYISSTASFPFTVLAADLVALTEGSTSVSSKRFEGRSAVTVTSITEDFYLANVDTSTDKITLGETYITGEKVIFSGSDLPSPLEAGTEYWIINNGDGTISISSSLTDAYSGSFLDITTQGTGTHVLTRYSFSATVYQQEAKDTQTIGESDGSEWQEFSLPDEKVLKDTLEISVNSVDQTLVETLIYSESTDNDFRFIYNTDETSKIMFGNGEYGAIPDSFSVEATYAVGGGSDSNVSAINGLKVYSGSDSNISGVSNPGSLTGGEDEESIASAKVLGPLLLKARDRFVTTDDGEALALAYGGFSQIVINKNTYGVLSCQIIGIAPGGGNPDSDTRASLQEYLIERTLLEAIDVRVEETTITSVDVTSTAKLLSTYTWDSVSIYLEFAWRLFFSETGAEVVDKYNDGGISDAIDLINTIFLTSFTETDDSSQIQELLENLDSRTIGGDIQESDAVSFIAGNVFGVDYIEVSLPTFPISTADDEITTDGVMSISEIS